MGGCSAPFCNNSAVKGYKMKALPKDPVRRTLWIKNVANIRIYIYLSKFTTANLWLCIIYFYNPCVIQKVF
ncbi:hypothetical protein ALC60_09370 [Trachymyrmex zeteki]|uniref:THAP-type domain-containing protein n=1 Tax=Mycetomoellerius zeteki TaxID=64791 RepID=A0A151WUR2_9HYME|nr:hypothetical protein ALC60_09370 [Trachymyrmex zeteki]